MLEASAGTGKTRVLVDRYVQPARSRRGPGDILAITFTRKAAAEMRERILARTARRGRSVARPTRALARAARTARRHRHLDDRRVLPRAPARVSARGRRGSRPSRSPTRREVPRLVERGARSRAAHLPPACASRRADVALVFVAARSPARCARGWRTLLDRRLVAPRASSTAFSQRAPDDLWTRDSCADGGWRSRRRARRSRRSRGAPRQRPAGSPAFPALARRPLRALDAFRARGDAAVRRLRRPRSREHFLHGEHGRAGERRGAAVRRSDHARPPPAEAPPHEAVRAGAEAEPLRPRLPTRTSTGCSRAACGACSPSRSPQYEHCSRTHAVLDFTGMLHARGRLAAARGDSRGAAEAPAALSARARRRVPGHQPAAVGARLAAHRAWGEGAGPAATAAADDLRRRRPQAVDLPVPPRRGRGARGGGRLHRGAPARRATCGTPISHSFRAVPELLAFVNDARARTCGARRRPRRRRSTTTTRIGFRAPRSRPRGAPRSGIGRAWRRRVDARAERWPTKIARLLATDAVPRSADRRARGPRPGTSRSSSGARAGHREFEDALDSAACHLRLQGTRLLRRRRDPGPAALLRYLARPDVRAPRRGVPPVAVRPALRRRARCAGARPGAAPSLRRRSSRRPRSPRPRRSRACSTPARRGCRGWLAVVDRVPPAELLDAHPRGDGLRVRDCAGRGSRRRGRT